MHFCSCEQVIYGRQGVDRVLGTGGYAQTWKMSKVLIREIVKKSLGDKRVNCDNFSASFFSKLIEKLPFKHQ